MPGIKEYMTAEQPDPTTPSELEKAIARDDFTEVDLEFPEDEPE